MEAIRKSGLQVIVYGVKPYNFQDEKTGRQVSGLNVFFSSVDSKNDEDGVGYVIEKCSLDYSMLEYFKGKTFPYVGEPLLKDIITRKGIIGKFADFEFKKKVTLKLGE